MNLEIVILVTLFFASLLLLFLNFRVSMYVLLFLSVLLHKELFSIYMWDVLPVRVFMSAVGAYGLVRLCLWFIKKLKSDPSEIKGSVLNNLKDPFSKALIFFIIAFASNLL